jgi:hypothetical protein
MWAAYHNYRTLTTLEEVMHLTLHIRRCLNRTCPRFRCPYRPETEGRLAWPTHEFGLDVIAWVGMLAMRSIAVFLTSINTCATVGWPWLRVR